MRLEAPRRVVGFCLPQSTAPRPRDSRSSSSAALVSGEEGGTFKHVVVCVPSLVCVWGFRLFLCYGKLRVTGILNSGPFVPVKKKSICEWLRRLLSRLRATSL